MVLLFYALIDNEQRSSLVGRPECLGTSVLRNSPTLNQEIEFESMRVNRILLETASSPAPVNDLTSDGNSSED